MHDSRWLLILGMCATAACARPPVIVVQPDALTQYESIRQVPAVVESATAGAVRAAALLALRERELGTTDSGYLEKARELAAMSPTVRQDVAPPLDLIAIMPWRAGTGRPGAPDQPLTIYQNRAQRLEMLRPLAARDELSAYV